MNIYRSALEVQDASNLSGIVYQFARAMTVICEEVRNNGGGTDAINRHPVCRMYAEQILWLSGGGSPANHRSYLKAHDECEKRAAEWQGDEDTKPHFGPWAQQVLEGLGDHNWEDLWGSLTRPYDEKGTVLQEIYDAFHRGDDPTELADQINERHGLGVWPRDH
jgi:hypothetical protein